MNTIVEFPRVLVILHGLSLYLNGTLCILHLQKDDIFPICTNSFEFRAQAACYWAFLIVVQWPRIFSSSWWVKLRTMWSDFSSAFCVFSLGFSVDSVDINCCFGWKNWWKVELCFCSKEMFLNNYKSCDEHKGIVTMLVLWLVKPTLREIWACSINDFTFSGEFESCFVSK